MQFINLAVSVAESNATEARMFATHLFACSQYCDSCSYRWNCPQLGCLHACTTQKTTQQNGSMNSELKHAGMSASQFQKTNVKRSIEMQTVFGIESR